MAEDWIKIRTDLYRDPKVCVIADILLDKEGQLARYVNQNEQRDMTVTRNVMRNAVVGTLVTVWGVMRQRGKRNDADLICRYCGISVIDDVAEMPGLGEAMRSVDWVIEEDEGIVFPNFFETYNVDPGMDQKAKNAERQRKYRERQREKNNVTRDVTVTSQSDTEKRREEKSNNTPKSPTGDYDESFESFWKIYPRKTSKKSAHKAWVKLKPDRDLQEKIISAVRKRARSDPEWLKDGGKFIPHGSTYLNGERWEDEWSDEDAVDGFMDEILRGAV